MVVTGKREPSPNHKLKHERELRGWSQAKLAEKIGASCATVNRWEQGVKLPTPSLRERLCSLFGKNTEELGLLPRDSAIDNKPSL